MQKLKMKIRFFGILFDCRSDMKDLINNSPMLNCCLH